MRLWISSLVVVLASWWVWGCDPMGYHSIGQFPSRLTAKRAALEHLLSRYWLVGLFGDPYKVVYLYPRNDIWRNEAVWYYKDNERLSLETDVGSGADTTVSKITHLDLKRLEVLTHQGILLDSAFHLPRH